MLVSDNRAPSTRHTVKHKIVTAWRPPRICVHSGRLLMGCLDELGVLEECQCFIQVSKSALEENFVNHWSELETKENIQVIIGYVLVTKNPYLYPGDNWCSWLAPFVWLSCLSSKWSLTASKRIIWKLPGWGFVFCYMGLETYSSEQEKHGSTWIWTRKTCRKVKHCDNWGTSAPLCNYTYIHVCVNATLLHYTNSWHVSRLMEINNIHN